MQVAKLLVRSALEAQQELCFNDKELLVLSEIGLNQVPSATSFVEYVAGEYGLSPSGIWYTLKKLKQKRVVDFTEKGEGLKPLALTELGVRIFRQQRSTPIYVPQPVAPQLSLP